jgi:RNA-directed DNA polymerase
MRKRLQEFALSLHSEKTRRIEFGRFAAANRKRRGLSKPETFTFLGFTFICSKTRRANYKSNGSPGGTACRQSCKLSNRNCDGACISRFPSREDGCTRSSPATSTTSGADERSDTDRIPLPRHQSLAAHATAAEPERLDDLGADQAVGPTTGSRNRESFIRGQRGASPLDTQGGAVCPNWARTDLCGGRGVTRVPTAKVIGAPQRHVRPP